MRPLQESAQREFAGFGQARAGRQRPLHGVPQHDGRAVAGDFDQVFGRVGARRLERR